MTDIKQEVIDGCKITYKKSKADSLRLFIQLLKDVEPKKESIKQEVS